jgi:hypothetical protein
MIHLLDETGRRPAMDDSNLPSIKPGTLRDDHEGFTDVCASYSLDWTYTYIYIVEFIDGVMLDARLLWHRISNYKTAHSLHILLGH